MNWRRTLALVGLLALILIFVWLFELREGGDSAQGRLNRGMLYPYEAEALKAFEIIYPERSFRMERRKDEWWMTAPVEDLGDQERIVPMLATLESQTVERWLPPPGPEQREEFGLLDPRLRLRLERRAGADTLIFGHLNEVTKRLWIGTSYRDSVGVIPPLLRTHFLKGYFELLDKHPLAPAPLKEIESVHVINDHGYFSLVPTGAGWEIQRTESYPADTGSVQHLLDQVWSSSIVEFVERSMDKMHALGFQNPAAKLTIKLKSGQPRQLEIGDSFFKLHYARDLDRPQIFMLDSLTTAPILASYSAYLSVVLFEFSPGEIIRIEGPEGEELIRREDSTWQWHDALGRKVSGDAVVRLLNRMMRLYTERMEALLPRQDQLQAWELDPPLDVYRLHSKRGGRVMVLELGGEQQGRRIFRRGDYPSVYSLPVDRLEFTWPGPEGEGE